MLSRPRPRRDPRSSRSAAGRRRLAALVLAWLTVLSALPLYTASAGHHGGSPPDNQPPTLLNETVDGALLVLTYDEGLDATAVVEPSFFEVTVDGAPLGVASVAIDGATVRLTLASAVAHGEAVRVSYDQTTESIRDLAGNHARQPENRPVYNATPPGAPAPPAPPAPDPLDVSGSVSPSGVPAGAWHDTRPVVTLTASNDSASILYCIGGEACEPSLAYGGPFEVPDTTGSHVRYVASTSETTSSVGALFLKVDATPPTASAAALCGVPGDAGWCRSAVTGSLSAADATSGLASTTCRVDGLAVPCGPFSVAGPGPHVVEVTATDHAGHTASDDASFQIDATPPTPSLVSDCPLDGAWCAAAGATYEAGATDGTSGLAEGSPSCTLDGADAACAGSVSGPGAFALAVAATDAAGNSASLVGTVRLDDVPPTLALTADCAVPGDAGWCRGGVTLALTDDDATSGVASRVCTLDDAPAPCAGVVSADGAHAFAATVTDAAGNAASDDVAFAVDATPPTLSVVPACAEPDAGDWCPGAVAVAVAASDATSGPPSLACALDGVPVDCAGIHVTSPGTHAATATARDAAGNEASASSVFRIDDSSPAVSVAAACPLVGADGWCRGAVAVSILIDDAPSGVSSAVCTLDGAPVTCGAFSVSAPGPHTVTAEATDLAGNAASASASFKVDGTPPALVLGVLCATPGDGGWCRGGLTAAASASDAASGIASLVCAADGTPVPCDAIPVPSGHHAVSATATDEAGNVATASAAYALDSDAPAVSASAVCSASGTGGWCGGAVSLDAEATDAGSGLASLECTLDGAPVACAGGSASAPGTHVFVATARDAAGHESVATREFRIDAAAPVVTIAAPCGVPGDGGWCRAPVAIQATATDDVSGVAELACTLDGVPASCGPLAAPAGEHVFTASAVDAAGNAAFRVATVRVDATPPTLAVTPVCAAPGASGWCRGVVDVAVAASDADSGLAPGQPACAVDGVARPCAGLAVATPGAHVVRVEAADEAGHVTVWEEEVAVDDDAPAVAVSLGCAAPGNAGWCRAPVALGVEASDATSGVRARSCRLDGAPVACEPATVSEPGTHTFTATAEDEAGNEGSDGGGFSVDGTPPSVEVSTSCAAPGEGGWCRGEVVVAVAASDAESGLAEGYPTCTLDGAAVACEGLVVSAPGAHTVVATARDVAGNEANDTASFTVDADPPVVAVAVSCGAGGDGVWCRGPVTFTPSASDAVSGLASGSPTCALDGAAVACEPVAVSAPGTHAFDAGAVDAAGNAADANATYGVDDVAPAVSVVAACDVPGEADWCRGQLTFTVEASDAHSGLASLVCTLDGEPADCADPVVPPGPHTLVATATDVAGNVAQASSEEGEDTVPPVVSATAVCDLPGDDGWCVGVVTASASASDATSGLESLVCLLDGAPVDCAGVVVHAAGLHAFHATARDVAGHEAYHNLTFAIDADPPVLVLEAPCEAPGAGGWCLAPVTVTANASDAVSGLAAGSPACTLDGVPVACGVFVVDAAGEHVVTVSATDGAGHAATASTTLLVDASPPALAFATSPAAPDGLAGWFRSPPHVTLVATDDGSGVNASTLAWSLDGVTFVDGDAFTLADGEHVRWARVRDLAGHETIVGPTTWRVDTVPPAAVSSDGAGGVADDPVLRIRFAFSEAMDAATTEAAVTGADGFSRAWSPDGTVLFLNRTGVVTSETHVQVGDGATDAHGVPLAPGGARAVLVAPPAPAAPPAPPPPPPAAAPGAPTGLAAEAGPARVALTWAPPASDGGAPVTGYVVYRASGGGAPAAVATVGGTSFTDHGLTNGVAYTYTVAARNSAGEGPRSGEASATPRPAAPPATTLTVSPADPDGTDGWFRTSPVLSFAALPPEALVEVALGDAELAPYAGPFSLPSGVHEVRWRATLEGASPEPERRATFRVDLDDPVLSGLALSAPTMTRGGDIEVLARATDATSGVALVKAVASSPTGATAETVLALGPGGVYRGRLGPSAIGTYAVSVEAVDRAGRSAGAGAGSFTVAAPLESTEVDEPTPGDEGGASDGGGSGGGGGGGVPSVPSAPRAATPGDESVEIRVLRTAIFGGDARVEVEGIENPERIILVLVHPDGHEEVLARGTTVVVWNISSYENGFYRVDARELPEERADGGGNRVGILQLSPEDRRAVTVASSSILVENPRITPAAAAAAAATGVAFTAGAAALAARGFDLFAFLQDAVVDVGQDRFRDKANALLAKKQAARRRRVGNLAAAAITILTAAAAFAYVEVEALHLGELVHAAVVVGTAAVLYGVAKYACEYGIARATGAATGFRLFGPGAIALGVSTVLFRAPFGYAGYIDENEPGDDEDHAQRRLAGLRSLAFIGVNVTFALPFVAAARWIDFEFGEAGLFIAMVGLAMTAMPFKPVPGYDVWRWNRGVAVLTFLAAFGLYFGYVLAVVPMPVLLAVGVVGGVGFAYAFVRLRYQAHVLGLDH